MEEVYRRSADEDGGRVGMGKTHFFKTRFVNFHSRFRILKPLQKKCLGLPKKVFYLFQLRFSVFQAFWKIPKVSPKQGKGIVYRFPMIPPCLNLIFSL